MELVVFNVNTDKNKKSISKREITPKRNVSHLISSERADVSIFLSYFFLNHELNSFQRICLDPGKVLCLVNKHVNQKTNVTKVDAMLLKWLAGELPEILLDKLLEWTREFIRLVPPSVRNGITLMTWHCGRWRKSNPREFDILTSRSGPGATYLRNIKMMLAPIVDSAFRHHFPELAAFMKKVNGDYEKNAAFAWKGFALNSTKSTWHVDGHDYIDGMCALVPFGDYSGGDLVFPDLGLKFNLCPGDILFFSSRRLIHGNLDYEGERYSIVFFLHQVAVSDYLVKKNYLGISKMGEALEFCKAHYSYKDPPVKKAEKNMNVPQDLEMFKNKRRYINK